MKITLPHVETQRAIASILGALDDKIELDRKMNRTIEATAQSLFKSWFVDFDPVIAKMGRKKPYGMDKATASLFPNRLVESPIGQVPEGWEILPISKPIKVNPRRALPNGSAAPYLDMQNMPTTSAIPEFWITRRVGSGMRFTNGDTLVARITPCLENGKTAFVNFLECGQIGWGSTEYIVLRSDDDLPQSYSYFLARTDEFRSYAISNMTGSSGRQRVPSSSLDKLVLAFPPKEIADKFGIYADKALEIMKSNQNESRVLSAMRDTLLPKLFSGEIRVKEV
jgi:type I restriction enzyme S subunit